MISEEYFEERNSNLNLTILICRGTYDYVDVIMYIWSGVSIISL